jgi:benzil reductase ((S)-benzoin forming)
MQDLVILTGASRGMGLAMARQLLAPGRPCCASRASTNPELERTGRTRQATCCSGRRTSPTRHRRRRGWSSGCRSARRPHAGQRHADQQRRRDPAHRAAGALPAATAGQALRVGLEAPMLLTAAFLNASGAWVDAGWRGPRKVLNISSGLGRRAMAARRPTAPPRPAWTTSAAAWRWTKRQREHGARIVSLAPGVIDTDMQVQLRAGDPDRFPDRQRFVELQRQGSSPARRRRGPRAGLAGTPDFGAQPVADVRD